MDQRLEPLQNKDYLSLIQNGSGTNSMIDVEIIKQTFAAASYGWAIALNFIEFDLEKAIAFLKASQPVIAVWLDRIHQRERK